MMRIVSAICERPWAITARAMEGMLDILDKRASEVDALAGRTGEPLENTGNRVTVRDGIAVLGVTGPMFRYGNILTRISGATSVEMLSRDFHTALDDPKVRHIVLDINSPGGEVDGVGELAGMIHQARGVKPVTAYIGGTGASGAYWLASAADRIVMHETAVAGSVGVVATVTDSREAQEKAGIRRYEIVSSQSPDKRADVATPEGRALVQTMVDEMADVFISRVAQYRSVTPETVTAEFGRGFVRSAKRAVGAGMADAVGSFEELMGVLAAGRGGQRLAVAAGTIAGLEKEEPMADEKKPDTAEEMGQKAVTAERTRIAAILNCPEAEGRQKLAHALAFDTAMTPAEAQKLLAASEKAAPAAAEPPKTDGLTEQMRKLANPAVGVRTDDGGAADDTDAEVRAVLAFVPRAMRRAS